MSPIVKLLLIGLLTALPHVAAGAQNTPAPDKIVIQINEEDGKTLNQALNNVQNLIGYYKEKGELPDIEVVSFGPGLHMLRQDTSPVKERIAAIARANPTVQFSACNNTLNKMASAEGKPPALVSEATMVPSGIARIVELQKQGYIYVRP